MGSSSQRSIRIVILGDAGVGKTSLVQALLTESFPEKVPEVLPEVSIPKEVSPDGVNTVLIDTSCLPENRKKVEEELKKASAIMIVYAIDDSRSFQRLGTYWLPFVRSTGTSAPIVLVGNKIDMRGPDVSNEDLEDEILPLMSDFREIETCVECSASTLINVAEAFYFAQKAVLHPTAPLYDSHEHRMKEEAIKALERIFRLSDLDRDGVLSDEELNLFQQKCFGTALQREELESIRSILQEADPSAISDKGVTIEGFILLHKLFIQRGRLETTWSALRAFGYTDQLELKTELLFPEIRVPKDASVNLSPKGYAFLTALFKSYDLDNCGSLYWEDLERLFSVAPENPWLALGFPTTTVTDAKGGVTLEGFLAQWAMTTLLNWRVTLEYLAWLGYDQGPTTEAIKVIPNGNRLDRSTRTQRDTFLVWVLGATGSGKTSLCRNLVRLPFNVAGYQPTMTPYHTVASVPVDGHERYLCLEEISTHGALDKEVIADPALLSMVDAVVYVYDQSDAHSFAHIIKLRKEHPELDHLPAIVLVTKSDLAAAEQKADQSPEAFCSSNEIIGPIPVSVKEELDLTDVHAKILQLAMKPPRYQSSRSWLAPGLAVTLVAVGAASAFAYYRWRKLHPSE